MIVSIPRSLIDHSYMFRDRPAPLSVMTVLTMRAFSTGQKLQIVDFLITRTSAYWGLESLAHILFSPIMNFYIWKCTPDMSSLFFFWIGTFSNLNANWDHVTGFPRLTSKSLVLTVITIITAGFWHLSIVILKRTEWLITLVVHLSYGRLSYFLSFLDA